jgi:hypothetical protein
MNTPLSTPVKRQASPAPQETTPGPSPAKCEGGPVARDEPAEQFLTPEATKTKRYRPTEAALAPEQVERRAKPRDFLAAATTRGIFRFIGPPATDLEAAQAEDEEPALGGGEPELDLLGDDDVDN